MSNVQLYIIRFIIIAFIYWLASWFGKPTDIWPAAGFALACCIVYGIKYWPAIVIGSLMAHYQINSAIHLSSVALSLGGGVQAALGAWAFKKASNNSNGLNFEKVYTFDKTTDIFKLIFWGGVLPCLINASVAVLTLSQEELAQFGIQTAHWYVWWVGDILGIALCTPALILILQDLRSQKKNTSTSRKISMAVAGLVMLVAITIIFSIVKKEFHHEATHQIKDKVTNISFKLQRDIEVYINSIKSLGNFIESSEEVTYEEYQRFTKTFLSSHPGISGVAWASKSPNREETFNFPIVYIEPSDTALLKRGINLLNNPSLVELMETGNDSGAGKLSELLPATDSQTPEHIAIFVPIYKNHIKGTTTKERYQNLKGFAIGMFLLPDLLKEAKIIAEKEGFDVVIRDISDKRSRKILYDSRSKSRKYSSDLSYDFASQAHYIYEINLANKHWKVIFIETGLAKHSAQYSWALWFTISLGTLFAIIMTAFLLATTARTDLVERLVAKKTSELKSAEAFQKLVTDTIPDYIIVKDSTLRTVTVNKAVLNALQKSGQDQDTIIGKKAGDFFPPSQAEREEELDREALERGHVESEEQVTMPSGQHITLSTKRVSFKDSEGKSYILGIARDITEMKETEAELRNLNTELEEFSYRTSHDLRAPVVSALGLLDLVRNSLDLGNTDEAYRGIEHVYNSLQKVDVLVEGILDITAIKRKEKDVKTVDIKKLIEDAIEKFQFMDNFENIDIQKDLRFKGTLVSQESRIKVIIENLFSNAIKYHDPEKDHPFIKISTAQDGNDFVLRIEDNGLGIPQVYQSKLFQMFRRFHPKVSFGSGLGLYLVKKSADVLKGNVAYEDTGDGSAFTFRMPLNNNDE